MNGQKILEEYNVQERVAHGGHNIPVQDIARRFPRSLNNLLNAFSHTVDRWKSQRGLASKMPS